MEFFEKQVFEGFYDRDSGAIFSDLEFRRCRFVSCAISITLEPKLRTTVRNVRLLNCEMLGCTLDTAVVEDVLINGLKTNGTRQAWGAIYKHVVLKGRLGTLMLSSVVSPGIATAKQQQMFDDANAEYYKMVDWALDISEGEFEDIDIRGVPAHLIRRDPSTQVVIKRENAMEGKWRNLDLSKTHWATSIEFFLKRGDPDVVLVAPKRHRKYRELLNGLLVLRAAGIAEPE